ncbi:AMP-binding protein [Halorarius halobius]|uniref:AMP-binding protein n=1 Tax=Halorarius halobius TaxID=2962671 RepID=UPI0020CC1916|nr:AMP-binding protein [Halorarius halobius]
MTAEKSYLSATQSSYVERYGDELPDWKEQGYLPEQTFPEQAYSTFEQYPAKRVVGPNRTETFDDVRREAERLAAGLQSLGLEPGDVVSYALPNWVTTTVVHLGISMAGAIANPIVPIYRHREFEYILDDVESDAIIVPDVHREFDFREMLDDIAADVPVDDVVVVGTPLEGQIGYDALLADDTDYTRPDLSPDDPHVVLYTSGTTSDPKGVVHTHNSVGACEMPMRNRMEYSSDETFFVPTPVTHISGVVRGLRLPFIVGADLVLMDRWKPADAVDLVDSEGVTRMGAATPFVQGLLEEAPADWDCPLEVVGCGGANVSPELIRRAAETFDCWAYRGWGMTEYPGATKTSVGGDPEKAADTDGRLLPGTRIEIVDLDSREAVEQGDEGEILVTGPHVMLGYIGEDLNDEAFTGKWFATGDVGYMDTDGYLEITGRAKDVIIRGGENIPVNDVEDKLKEHSAIDDVAIVAMPDPDLQEKGCAYVSLVEGETFSFEEMTAHLDEKNIARQKYPERLEIVEEFPRTASGKIQKSDLREAIADVLNMEPVSR